MDNKIELRSIHIRDSAVLRTRGLMEGTLSLIEDDIRSFGRGSSGEALIALKNEEIYNIFDTEAILARPPKVSINNASGLAGVAYWVNEYRAKRGEPELPKKHELVQKIYDWITAEYENGRVTVISESEMIERYTEYSE